MKQPRLYEKCQNCGAHLGGEYQWRDAFCDDNCHESYLVKRYWYRQRSIARKYNPPTDSEERLERTAASHADAYATYYG